MSSLISRCEAVEERLSKLELALVGTSNKYETTETARVKLDLLSRGLLQQCRIVHVPPNYYQVPLQERAVLLNAHINQLCKSIVFENKECESTDCSDRTNSRYYLIVLQYAAKFEASLLADVVHSLRPPAERLPKKRFHFQLAPEDVNEALTGCTHNAVTPFGLLNSSIPVIVCKRLLDMQPKFLYLGGGAVDVKLGMPLDSFIKATNAIVGEISSVRSAFTEVTEDE